MKTTDVPRPIEGDELDVAWTRLGLPAPSEDERRRLEERAAVAQARHRLSEDYVPWKLRCAGYDARDVRIDLTSTLDALDVVAPGSDAEEWQRTGFRHLLRRIADGRFLLAASHGVGVAVEAAERAERRLRSAPRRPDVVVRAIGRSVDSDTDSYFRALIGSVRALSDDIADDVHAAIVRHRQYTGAAEADQLYRGPATGRQRRTVTRAEARAALACLSAQDRAALKAWTPRNDARPTTSAERKRLHDARRRYFRAIDEVREAARCSEVQP